MIIASALSIVLALVAGAATAQDFARLQRLSTEISDLTVNLPDNTRRAVRVVEGIQEEADAFCRLQLPQCGLARNLAQSAVNSLQQIQQAIGSRTESTLQTALDTNNRVNQIANRVEQDRATAFNRTALTNRSAQLRADLLANPPQTEAEAERVFRTINQERFRVCGQVPRTSADCQFAQSVVREARLILTQIRANNANNALALENAQVNQVNQVNNAVRSLRQELQLVGLTPEQVPEGLREALRGIVRRRNDVCRPNPFSPQCNAQQQNVANARNEVAAILAN